MNTQRTYQRNGNPTLGRINQTIRNMKDEGNLPSLYQMELPGWVSYNRGDGTYRLTEKGKQKLQDNKRVK